MIDTDTGKLLQLSWAGQGEERRFLRESVTRSCGHSRDGNTLYIFSFPHVPSIKTTKHTESIFQINFTKPENTVNL